MDENEEEKVELEETFRVEDAGHNKIHEPEYVNQMGAKNAKLSNKDKVKVVEKDEDGNDIVVEKKVAKKRNQG